MTTIAEKTALRQKLRAQRRRIPDKSELDRRLLAHILAHPWVQEADTVLLYCSGRWEADTHALLDWLLVSGKKAALPVCGEKGSMRFYLLHSTEELQPGAYGIPVPSGREEPVLTERSLCIVPGVAFAKNGERLGQGGGYYDRFLQLHPALRTMGLTYECLLQDTLPCEAHDCRVDVVMTDGGAALRNLSGGI